MALPFNYDDASRDARPSIWIFNGDSAVLLIGATLASIVAFRFLAGFEVDWQVNLGVSVLPIVAVSVFVATLVNGKSPSYPLCFFSWAILRLSTRLYLRGVLDRPALLWRMPKAPVHPLDFDQHPV